MIDLADFAEWWPRLCAWENEAFMVRTHHQCMMWSHAQARCGKAAGILEVTRQMSEEFGFEGHWRARVRYACPHLCRGPEDWHPFWSMKDANCYQ